jgi:hypothetical protein
MRLVDAVAAMLSQPVRPEIHAAARQVCARLGGDAVLFYGSNLRRGDLDGLVDFYVITNRPSRGVGAVIWPDVGYHEVNLGAVTVRAKVAVLSLAQFHNAASGDGIDTTVWTRFSQPSRLLVSADASTANAVARAVAQAIRTAARFALALGPQQGRIEDWWRALFRQTYRAELRVEPPTRSAAILDGDPDHFRTMLPLAWASQAIASSREGDILRPEVPPVLIRRWKRAWRVRRVLGKPLNAVRLVKAAFTFEGATRYALWKIERHTGLRLAVTPWRERHPILAAPGVLLRLWQARRA